MHAPNAAYSANNATITLHATGPCGAFSKSYNFQVVARSSGYYVIRISPNPANNNIIITQEDSLATIPALQAGATSNTKADGLTSIANREANAKEAQKTRNNRQAPGIRRVRIFDVDGRLKKVIEGITAKQLQVDVSALLPGVYMVEITSGTDMQRQKIVIQH